MICHYSKDESLYYYLLYILCIDLKFIAFLFKIPYYIDDDIKITQSNSILRFIGDKHDVCKYLLLWPLILNRDNLMYNTL